MKPTAKAILRYPFNDSGRVLNSVVTVLDRVAVRREQTDVYGLPGGGIDRGETPYQALVRELGEEFGLRVKSASEVTRIGRHHLFLVDEVEGVVDQNSIQTSEVLGIGFLNSGPRRRIPNDRLQRHVRVMLSQSMGRISGLQVDWPKDVDPGYKIRGYFFTGNNNPQFYDWEQQLDVLRKGGRFAA